MHPKTLKNSYICGWMVVNCLCENISMIFLEIHIHAAPFFVYNSTCISKAESNKLNEISKHHSFCGVQKVEFEIRFMPKQHAIEV
jgi:hypothetical protein